MIFVTHDQVEAMTLAGPHLVQTANPELAIQLPSGLELTPGHKITLGVRPEHLTLRPDADERGLEGKVVFAKIVVRKALWRWTLVAYNS